MMKWTCCYSVFAVLCMMSAGMAFAEGAAPAGGAGKDPLDELFPTAEIRDVPSLKLKRISDAVMKEKTPSGAAIRKIEIEFTAFDWAGETFRYEAGLYIPAQSPAPYRDGAVVDNMGGDERGLGFAKQGLASVVLIDAPGKHFGVGDASTLMGYAEDKYAATGDPHWLGYPWLARIFVRAITAAGEIPEFGKRRFVVTGGSKWGEASWIAAAVDDRIIGAFPTSWNSGNMEKSLRLKAARMGITYQAGKPGAKAPASRSTSDQLDFMTSPRGRLSRAYLDPVLFRDRLANKPVLFCDGTNDKLFPCDGDTVFMPEMRGDIRICLYPNKGHSISSTVARPMWLAHVFAGRDVPRIDVSDKAAPGKLEVTATVSSRTKINSVTLWNAAAADRVFLNAEWKPEAMKSSGKGIYEASLATPAKGSIAYVVIVEDEDPATVPGIISTGFHEWPLQSR